MAIKSPEAKSLCTESEFQLFQDSLAQAVKQLTTSELRKNLTRARKLRDKWRDQAQRQQREARGKQQPRGARPARGAERTDRKAQLFAETLARFEERLQQLETTPSATAAPKKTTRKKGVKAAPAGKKKAVSAATKKKSSSKKTVTTKKAVKKKKKQG